MNLQWITGAIDSLTTHYGVFFVTEGRSWLQWLGIIILTVYSLKWAMVSVSGQGGYDIPGLIQFFVMFVIAGSMLASYSAPIPGTTSTVASILPDTAEQLSHMISDLQLATVTTQFHALMNNIGDAPSVITNTAAFIAWLEVYVVVQITEAFMLLTQILGFLALGVLVLLGPLMIPFFIVPRLSWLFWNWFQAMLEFSFWRVVSTAIVFVWSTSWSLFMDNAIRGDYSLPHLAQLVPYMFALSLGTIISLIWLPAKLTSDLFKGTATAGANWVSTAAIIIRAAA